MLQIIKTVEIRITYFAGDVAPVTLYCVYLAWLYVFFMGYVPEIFSFIIIIIIHNINIYIQGTFCSVSRRESRCNFSRSLINNKNMIKTSRFIIFLSCNVSFIPLCATLLWFRDTPRPHLRSMPIIFQRLSQFTNWVSVTQTCRSRLPRSIAVGMPSGWPRLLPTVAYYINTTDTAIQQISILRSPSGNKILASIWQRIIDCMRQL